MLAIRLQRVGRKGLPVYRIIVQEAHRQPTSGKLVAHVGTYNPHTKELKVDKEKAELYLKNGAQPSPRVVSLFIKEKVKLPDWVVTPAKKAGKTRNPEKLRKNQPKEVKAEAPAEEKPEEAVAEEPTTPEEPALEEKAEVETPAEEPAAEEKAEAKE